MQEQSVLLRLCPVCGHRPVEQIRGPKGIGAPTHRCPACAALLKPVFTARMLMCIPIGVFSLGITYFCLNWVNGFPALPGVARAALVGGLGAFSMAVTLNSALRGIVFRPLPRGS